MATGKNFAQMSSKKLRELMQHAEPEDAKAIKELLEMRGTLESDMKNKFTVIKHIGKNDKFVIREFNDRDDAKKFVDLLRKSEQLDFIKYSISQALNY